MFLYLNKAFEYKIYRHRIDIFNFKSMPIFVTTLIIIDHQLLCFSFSYHHFVTYLS